MQCTGQQADLVRNIEHDAANTAILKAIIVLGQSLGLKVIAVGVASS